MLFVRDSPELHRSTVPRTARPLSRCGLIYLRRPLSSHSVHRAMDKAKQRCTFAAFPAALSQNRSDFCGNYRCYRWQRVTKHQIFALLTERFSGSASSRRRGRGSSQYLFVRCNGRKRGQETRPTGGRVSARVNELRISCALLRRISLTPSHTRVSISARL